MAALARARLSLVPPYERSSTATMAHVGLGAFARAHLGVYADDLNRLGRPALIRGVSLMSDRAEQQMGPQDGLYTVAEREPDDDVTLRVVGSMTSVRTGTAAVFDAVSAPTTDLVTVTITESGYDIPWAPPDLESPSPWVPEIIARALAHHRRAGSAPPIVASLDNLLGNGEILRQRRAEFGRAPGPDPAGLDCRRGRVPELCGRSYGAGAHRRRQTRCRGAPGPPRPRHGVGGTIPILDTRRGRRTAAVGRRRRGGRGGRDAVRAPQARGC